MQLKIAILKGMRRAWNLGEHCQREGRKCIRGSRETLAARCKAKQIQEITVVIVGSEVIRRRWRSYNRIITNYTASCDEPMTDTWTNKLRTGKLKINCMHTNFKLRTCAFKLIGYRCKCRITRISWANSRNDIIQIAWGRVTMASWISMILTVLRITHAQMLCFSPKILCSLLPNQRIMKSSNLNVSCVKRSINSSMQWSFFRGP